ncbi:MAG: nucleotidyltransferase [Nanobdellota archaeon]
MIETKDQEELFRLIADYLEKDITCTAIGGTAMMFLGYKTATKDIDLVFKNRKDRNEFIKAIESLGYRESSLKDIYDKRREKEKGKPVMLTRGEERFDLFYRDVFGLKIDTSVENLTKREDFLGKKELIIYMPSPEDLILLKSVTGRDKDHEDIETLIETKEDIDWDSIVDKAISQRKNNQWVLIDLEETLREIKKKFFIKNRIFDRIYREEENHRS